jgi:hypothetical protein
VVPKWCQNACGSGDASSYADQIRRVKVRGGGVPYVPGNGVPPHEELIVALADHVALEEAIYHAYSQTRLESPNLRLGELPISLQMGPEPPGTSTKILLRWWSARPSLGRGRIPS